MVFLATLAAVLAAGWLAWRFIEPGSAKKPAAGPPPVPVTAAVATPRNVPQIVPAVGTVVSIDTVNVTPLVNGRITNIYFNQGDEVKADQPLFEIDPRPYQAALDQAKGQLAHDQAALAEAKVDYDRYRKLLSENSIAQQTAADQAAVVQQDEGTIQQDAANLANAELNLSYTKVKSPIDGRTGPILVDLGNYVTASSGASPSTAGTTAGAAAGGATITSGAATAASGTSPAAPATGTAVSAAAPTASAAPAAAGAALVTITRMHPIYVMFNVPETELDTIRENQAKAPLTVEAYTQAGKLVASGKLTLISNQINLATGTILLEATFPNQREKLWPNQFVSVRLIEFTHNNVITVPTTAVMTGPNGQYVYVIGAGNKVNRVDVDVIAMQDSLAVIGKGLTAGEQVVTEGQYRLDNGVVVSVKPAPATPTQTPAAPNPAKPTPTAPAVPAAPAPAVAAGTSSPAGSTAAASGSARTGSGD
jgi:membrane fusion protein, multidrug efflux system